MPIQGTVKGEVNTMEGKDACRLVKKGNKCIQICDGKGERDVPMEYCEKPEK